MRLSRITHSRQSHYRLNPAQTHCIVQLTLAMDNAIQRLSRIFELSRFGGAAKVETPPPKV
jgi:hypothetical protein